MVREIDVPAAARRLSTLPSIDYEDAFLVELQRAAARTPVEWARAALEGVPARTRRNLRLGWSAFGLRLGPEGSDRHVLGWELRRSTPAFALLGAESWLGLSGELLFKPDGDALLFATFVRQRNPIGRALWFGIERGHRRVVPQVLGRRGLAPAV